MEISTLRTLIDKEIDRIPGIRKDYKKSIVILKKEMAKPIQNEWIYLINGY